MGFKEWREAFKGFTGEGLYPHQMAFLLDIPLRRFIISPEELVDKLYLSKNSKVLELGPGPGYFSVEVASRTPDGRLELLDIQPEMLQKVKRKIQCAGFNNAGYTQGNASNLPFADNQFDVIFLVTVLGEVQDHAACISEIHRVLRPDGLLSITEQASDTDHILLPDLRSLIEKHGFEFVEIFEKPKQPWRGLAKKFGVYTANFRKRIS